MRNLKGGVCYEMAIGDVELDEGPLNIIMAYLLKATGPRERTRSSYRRPCELGPFSTYKLPSPRTSWTRGGRGRPRS